MRTARAIVDLAQDGGAAALDNALRAKNYDLAGALAVAGARRATVAKGGNEVDVSGHSSSGEQEEEEEEEEDGLDGIDLDNEEECRDRPKRT